MILRPYTPADFDSVVALCQLNTPKYICPPEQADLEEFLLTELEYYFVIEENGQILASGGCNTEDNIGWLSWYIVHPEHQGKGLGKLLLDKNLSILKSLPHLTGIKVRTSQLVYPFYEKTGFVLTRTEDNYWGEGMHLYEMELPDLGNHSTLM